MFSLRSASRRNPADSSSRQDVSFRFVPFPVSPLFVFVDRFQDKVDRQRLLIRRGNQRFPAAGLDAVIAELRVIAARIEDPLHFSEGCRTASRNPFLKRTRSRRKRAPAPPREKRGNKSPYTKRSRPEAISGSQRDDPSFSFHSKRSRKQSFRGPRGSRLHVSGSGFPGWQSAFRASNPGIFRIPQEHPHT